jgi:hypothetical protein
MSTGRLAPLSMAARTSRSRMPLQLQTYMAFGPFPSSPSQAGRTSYLMKCERPCNSFA